MILDRQMAMIEELDERIKGIESNLKLISDEILKANRRIMKMEMKFEERIGESKDLANEIRKIGSTLQELDLRIQHFEKSYRRRN